MIEIKKIKPPTVFVDSPHGKSYILNEYEFLDLRAQIRRNAEEGWACYSSSGELCPINKYGKLEQHPAQFDIMMELLFELI